MLVREGLSGRVTCLGGQNEVNRLVSRLSVARILQEKEWWVQRPCVCEERGCWELNRVRDRMLGKEVRSVRD